MVQGLHFSDFILRDLLHGAEGLVDAWHDFVEGILRLHLKLKGLVNGGLNLDLVSRESILLNAHFLILFLYIDDDLDEFALLLLEQRSLTAQLITEGLYLGHRLLYLL